MSRFVLSQAAADGGSSDEAEEELGIGNHYINDSFINDESESEYSTQTSQLLVEVVPDLDSSDEVPAANHMDNEEEEFDDEDPADDSSIQEIMPPPPQSSTPRATTSTRTRAVRIIEDEDDDRLSTPPKRQCRMAQTSPSLLKGLVATASGQSEPPGPSAPSEPSLDEECEGGQCPVCLDKGNTTGDHRLVSLKCGHYFGKSCVERWLNTLPRKDQRCPQCNQKVRKTDIRPLFAKNIVAIDVEALSVANEERDRCKETLRSTEMQVAQLQARLREREDKVQELSKLLLNNFSKQNASTSRQIPQNVPARARPIFQQIKVSPIDANGTCRTSSYSKILQNLVVSQKSSSNLFPGYGVRLIDTRECKMVLNNFIPIHQGVIKDIAFKPDDTLLLSTSVDKTLKVTNLVSKSVVANISLPREGWSCTWNTERSNYFYAGLQTGVVCEYDIRQPGEPVITFEAFDASPLHSVHHVSNDEFKGLFCTSLKSNFFHEFLSEEVYMSHPLPFEGRFLPAHYDSTSGYALVSTRPSAAVPSVGKSTVVHSLVEFIKPFDKVTAQVVRKYEGGSQSVLLSKSKVYADPTSYEGQALVFGIDESARGVIVWDSASSQPLQTLQIGPSNRVIDIELLDANEDEFTISLLTDRSLFTFRKQC